VAAIAENGKVTGCCQRLQEAATRKHSSLYATAARNFMSAVGCKINRIKSTHKLATNTPTSQMKLHSALQASNFADLATKDAR